MDPWLVGAGYEIVLHSALNYTVSGMVGAFLAKSVGGLSWEGIYLYVNSRVEKTNSLK